MGILTSRERQILVQLRNGLRVRDIARRLRVSETSISRSISNIREKSRDLEEDARFLCEIGYMEIRGSGLLHATPGGDPKDLGKRRGRAPT